MEINVGVMCKRPRTLSILVAFSGKDKLPVWRVAIKLQRDNLEMRDKFLVFNRQQRKIGQKFHCKFWCTADGNGAIQWTEVILLKYELRCGPSFPRKNTKQINKFQEFANIL